MYAISVFRNFRIAQRNGEKKNQKQKLFCVRFLVDCILFTQNYSKHTIAKPVMLEYRIVLRRDRNQTKPETLTNVAWWCFVDWAWFLIVVVAAIVVICSATFGTLQHIQTESKRSDLCILLYATRVRSHVFLCMCVCVGKCARTACARWCSLIRLANVESTLY